MTEPTPSQTALDEYVAANAGRYTEEALYSTLVAAGYPAEDVRVALASAAANVQPRRAGPRAVRTITVAYVAVFALLSAGMLLNHRAGGFPLMPNAGSGIGILATSLGVCFVASLIWVASRRLFVILLLILIALYGFAALTSGGGGSLSLVIVAFAIGGVVVLLRRPPPAGTIGEPELALLLVLPVILLLGVGGICVASGLPIPGTP